MFFKKGLFWWLKFKLGVNQTEIESKLNFYSWNIIFFSRFKICQKIFTKNKWKIREKSLRKSLQEQTQKWVSLLWKFPWFFLHHLVIIFISYRRTGKETSSEQEQVYRKIDGKLPTSFLNRLLLPHRWCSLVQLSKILFPFALQQSFRYWITLKTSIAHEKWWFCAVREK